MSRCVPVPGQRAENRPESMHFVRKSGDFHFRDRSIVLPDLGREMRDVAIAAPPAAFYELGLRAENQGNSGLWRHAGAKTFRKTEYMLSSSSEAACK
jgi:hypothetical protein